MKVYKPNASKICIINSINIRFLAMNKQNSFSNFIISTILLGSMSISYFTPHAKAAQICDAEEISPEYKEICKELQDSEIRRELAESEQKRLEAERDAFKTTLPDTGIEPLEGKIDFGDLVFESTVLAYESMVSATSDVHLSLSSKIKENLETNKNAAILIYNLENGDDEVSQIYSLYKAFELQRNGLLDAYDQEKIELPRDNKESLATIAAAAGSAINLVKLFNVNQSVKPVTIDKLSLNALAAQLSKKFQSDNKTQVYYPNVHFLDTNKIDLILNQVGELLLIKEEAIEEVNNLNAANEDDAEKIKRVTNLNNQTDSLLKAIGINSEEQFSTSSEKDATVAIIELSKGASLKDLLDDKNLTPYILYVDVVAAGSNRSTESLFGGKLRHSGGVIVNYMLYNFQQGNPLYSDFVSEYSGFKKLESTEEAE